MELACGNTSSARTSSCCPELKSSTATPRTPSSSCSTPAIASRKWSHSTSCLALNAVSAACTVTVESRKPKKASRMSIPSRMPHNRHGPLMQARVGLDGPSRVNKMLVQLFARRALRRVVGGLNAANSPALLIIDVVNIKRIFLRDRIGDTEQFGVPVISLHRLTFGARFVHFAAYVHALVRDQIQAIELFMGCPARMMQVRRQSTAPRLLQNDSAGGRTGVTGCEHLRIEHRVKQSVAMDPGTMTVSQLGRLHG